jgi:quinol monooxygenase YgiN
LINVFTVEPVHQQELFDILVEATEKIMRNKPGFISANIHKSFDGIKVVNYAQWESREAFEAILRTPLAFLMHVAGIQGPVRGLRIGLRNG